MPRVLLVDDDRDLIELLGFSLKKAGFAPVAASTPLAALQQVERRTPDIVVLDVELGVWSGLDILEEVRKRTQIPILMLTGCASHEVEARSFELGADDYLQKPVSTASLIVRLRALLARYSRAGEVAEEHVQLSAALRDLVESHRQALATAQQAARVRDESLAIMAHDLLEPLTILESMAQLQHRRSIKNGVPATEPVIETLGDIEAMACKMAQQIVQLLASTGLEIDQVLDIAPSKKLLSGARDTGRSAQSG